MLSAIFTIKFTKYRIPQKPYFVGLFNFHTFYHGSVIYKESSV